MIRFAPRQYHTRMTSSDGNMFRVVALCEGNHRSPVISSHQGQWRGTLMFSLICTCNNGWANNRHAGDLTCQSAYYDVTVMHDGLCGVMKYGGTPENYVALMGMDFLTFDRNMTRWEPNEPIHLASRLTHNAIMTQLPQSDVKATL